MSEKGIEKLLIVEVIVLAGHYCGMLLIFHREVDSKIRTNIVNSPPNSRISYSFSMYIFYWSTSPLMVFWFITNTETSVSIRHRQLHIEIPFLPQDLNLTRQIHALPFDFFGFERPNLQKTLNSSILLFLTCILSNPYLSMVTESCQPTRTGSLGLELGTTPHS